MNNIYCFGFFDNNSQFIIVPSACNRRIATGFFDKWGHLATYS